MRFKFSLKVSLVCLALILGMCRLSYWQWQRYNQKLALIERLNLNLSIPAAEFNSLLPSKTEEWEKLLHRRVSLSGQYDFSHEMVLRNRRVDDEPGVFIITPFKISGSEQYILIQRGFIPIHLAKPADRSVFQKQPSGEILGLIKATQVRRIFSPHDEEAGAGNPWVDSWLRVDVENIQKQLPYAVLPVFLELMPPNSKNATVEELTNQMIRSDATKDDMLLLPMRMATMDKPKKIEREYPIPVFDTVIPPGRHLGYVFEWGMMAFLTLLIGIALQLKRRQ